MNKCKKAASRPETDCGHYGEKGVLRIVLADSGESPWAAVLHGFGGSHRGLKECVPVMLSVFFELLRGNCPFKVRPLVFSFWGLLCKDQSLKGSYMFSSNFKSVRYLVKYISIFA